MAEKCWMSGGEGTDIGTDTRVPSDPAGKLRDRSRPGALARLRRRRARLGLGGVAARRVTPVRNALQGFGAHRPWRREQEALSELHVVIEQVDHRAFAFDPFGNEVDAEAGE